MADPPLGSDRIRELIPHRYPFLLVDRVLELTAERVVAEKLISSNEPYLQGHFPGRPIMPGVLVIEALAQAAGVWAFSEIPEARGRGIALLGIEKARFRRPVVPGDVLTLDSHLLRRRGDLFRFKGLATVQGATAAEVELLASFVDWEEGT